MHRALPWMGNTSHNSEIGKDYEGKPVATKTTWAQHLGGHAVAGEGRHRVKLLSPLENL